MATSSKKALHSTFMTAEYIEKLRSLCTFSKTTTNEIIDIFKELHGSLSKGTSTPSTSSRGRRCSTDDSDPIAALQRASRARESFDRPCTDKSGAKQCWLVSELDPWNLVLSRGFIELREHSWGELFLEGYSRADNNTPRYRDALLVSLLVDVLLQQHRCVTIIVLNVAFSNMDMAIFWHSLQNGGEGVRHLEFTSESGELTLLQWFGIELWSYSVVCLPALHSLHISRLLFNDEVAQTLGNYMVTTTTLKSMVFNDVQAECKHATLFLDHLARNTTVTSLKFHEHFVLAQGGQALARVLKNHVALECLEIRGKEKYTPSAVLRAAVQSCSLKSLAVHKFTILAEDIEVMAAGLTRHPPSYAMEKSPRTRTSSLEKLSFFDSKRKPGLQAAYGKLIGGVLLQLTIKRCFLGDVFAVTAARKLRNDSRLRVLEVKDSGLPVSAIRILVKALEEHLLHADVGELRHHGFLSIGRDIPAGDDPEQQLTLMLDWPEKSIVNVMRSLEQNRSVRALMIEKTSFRTRAIKALARFVVENRMLNTLFLYLEDEDCGESFQYLAVCRELAEAVPRNRFLTTVGVNSEDVDRNSMIILDALRRNSMLVNEAVNFVHGSNDRNHVLAFETLQYSRTVFESLCLDVSGARAKEEIDKARRRLAVNYFIFAGVVKAKIVCHPRPKRKTTFDKLGKDVRAHICSYLILADVLDI
ncbi:uncharacterized protein LOC144108353 [Amblyomma americanum]